MEWIEPGMFARSKAGHDKGRLYLIWKTEEEWVFLVDGRLRPLENPKRKNRKHIQIIHERPENWPPETNEAVKRAIKNYEKQDIKVEE